MLRFVRIFIFWLFRPLTERSKGNLRVIAISFCLSSIIWIFNSLNKELVSNYTVPLVIKYSQDTFIPLKKLPVAIKVDFKGHGWNVFYSKYFCKAKPVTVFLNNPGIKSSLDTSLLKKIIAKDLGLMEVVRINLDSLEIPFDRKAQKWIFMKLVESSISMNKGFTRDKREIGRAHV